MLALPLEKISGRQKFLFFNLLSKMQKYEIMAIIANSVKESDAENVAKTSTVKRISDLGGNSTFEDFWGARGFAYIIKKEKWGFYFVAQFELDGQKLTELKKDLNLDKNVVRFLITKVGKNDPAPRKYADMQKEAAALAKENTEEAAPKSTEKPTPKKETPKPVEKAPEVKKDAVDKKLDAVLEDASADL